MILIGRRPIWIVRLLILIIGMRLRRMRLGLRRTIRVGLLRPNISGNGKKTHRRQNCYCELESCAHLRFDLGLCSI